MKKRILALITVMVMVFGLAACGNSDSENKKPDADDMTFDELKEAAKGNTVTFYGWGGDELLNQWLDDVFAPAMKENIRCRELRRS